MRLTLYLLGMAGLAQAQELPWDWRAAMNRVTSSSLRGHLSFLASDLLEGRDTPSRGLDVAAEYVAAHFRGLDLEPIHDGSYFLDSPREWIRPAGGTEMRIDHGSGVRDYLSRDLTVYSMEPLNLTAVPLIEYSRELTPEDARGKVVVVRSPTLRPLVRVGAAAFLIVDSNGFITANVDGGSLQDRDGKPLGIPALVIVRGSLPPAAGGRSISLRADASPRLNAPLRNVAAILRGTDPELKDTYVLISSHYDHIGTSGEGPGDRIFNGANDDASGTSGILELAETLARLPQRPRRSIILAAFTGEEKGLLGARAFIAAPPVPLRSIIAGISVEVIARSDKNDGSYKGKATITGRTMSSFGSLIEAALKDAGITVPAHKDEDAFFTRSDNLPFAQAGIPAHTVSCGFIDADYHQPGDEWQKADFDTMRDIVRGLTLATLRAADSGSGFTWSEQKNTEAFRQAASKLGQGAAPTQ